MVWKASVFFVCAKITICRQAELKNNARQDLIQIQTVGHLTLLFRGDIMC